MALNIQKGGILYQKKKQSQNLKNWERSDINLQNTKAYEPKKPIDNETQIRYYSYYKDKPE